jgi:FixJ family two-component response regulator
MSVSIGINVSESVYRRLVAVADARQEPVHKLVERLAVLAVTPPAPVDKRKYVRLTPERRERLRLLHTAGYFDGEIAKELGVDRRTVWNWRQRLELSAHQRRSITRQYDHAGTSSFRAGRVDGREIYE